MTPNIFPFSKYRIADKWPLNEQKNTRHMISTPEFGKMKDGAVVVNTARGAVIDEAALVEALDSGKIFSAGLDVFENEPEIHSGLIRNPNVFLLPHMGTWSYEVSTYQGPDSKPYPVFIF